MAASVNTISVDEVDTIDLSEYPLHQYNGKEAEADAYDKSLCQDNKDFTKFLNKCLFLDQTVEMEKIIQKVLLPAYVCADNEYKNSERFTRVIKKALQRLTDEPRKKYSHISDVTDTLKFHVRKVPKKRVNFVTLSTTSELGKKDDDSRKRVVVDNKRPKKSKKARLDVIAVDSEDDDSDVIPVEDTANNIVDVSNIRKARVDEDLLTAHNIAQKIFAGAVALDDEADKIEVDNEIIAVDEEGNKADNPMATAKPKKNIHKNKFKTKDFIKLKKSKSKLDAMFKYAESYEKSLVKIKDTKSKESKENYSPNSTQEIGTNYNTPIEIIDSQEISMEKEMKIVNGKTNTLDNLESPNTEINVDIHHDKNNLVANENLYVSNNRLLVPQMEIALEENKLNETKASDTKRYERIKVIEAEIVKYKKKIADLEVAEVTEDSSESAYIRCDRLQAHIVKLYKELCSLNDAEPVKGRQVRLRHLAEGIPEGPVRKLEKFLNKQVDEDGVAPFPDFADVVRCIEKSNVQDGLGWSKTRVHKEAHALFESCGRALQRRRQRRAWKDLRAQLPRATFDADPAAGDPELAAKLELNRQLALRKEAEVLEKFSRMEATSEKASVQQNEDATHDSGESTSCARENENVEPQTLKISEIWSVTEKIEEQQTSERTDDETLADVKREHYDETREEQIIHIKQEPYEVPVETYFKLDVSIAIEISDSDSSDDDSIYSYVE